MIDTIIKAVRANFAISPEPKKPFLCDFLEIWDENYKKSPFEDKDPEIYEDAPYVAIVMIVGLADKYKVKAEDVDSLLAIDPSQRREFKKVFKDIMQRNEFNPEEYRVFDGNYEGNKKWNIARFHTKYKLCDQYIQERNQMFLKKHAKVAPWFLKLRNLTFDGKKIPL